MKNTGKKLIHLFTLAILLLGVDLSVQAQDCPSSYSNTGGRLKFTWTTVRPTGITSVNWTDGVDYSGSDNGGASWRTDATNINPTGTESGTATFTYGGGTFNCNITGGALPIELMYFKAERTGNSTLISWATASEDNNSHFTIERSYDYENWEVVGVENGAGNSTTILKYEMVDYMPVVGTVYYRLRQDDYDGKYTYSSAVAVEVNNDIKLNIMGLYVENDVLKVSLEGAIQEEAIEVQITSLMGSVESTRTFTTNDLDRNMVNMDVSNLSDGVYTITVTQGAERVTGKFIK